MPFSAANQTFALEVKEALYRIAQEAMHNVVKHARASTIRASLKQANRHLVMVLADDGVGFDPASAHPGHLGLTSLRERATAVGADLAIASTRGQGTRLTIDLPV